MENVNHSIIIENKSKVTITAVLEVLSFSDKEIRLKIKDNKLIDVFGSLLKITCFDNANGKFIATGVIDSIRYKNTQLGLAKKVFK